MQRSNGFTLIELITVIIVLGALAAFAVPRLPNVTLFQSQFDGRQIVSSLSRLRAHALSSQCYVLVDFTGKELAASIESTDDCSAPLSDKALTTSLGFINATDIKGLTRQETGAEAFQLVFTPLGEAWFFDATLDLENPDRESQNLSHPSGRSIRVEGSTGYARWR